MEGTITLNPKIWFRKFYCCKCGTQLKKKKIKYILSPEEKKAYYKRAMLWRMPMTHLDVCEISTGLFCPACQQFIPVDEQLALAKVQKKLNKKILTENEIMLEKR